MRSFLIQLGRILAEALPLELWLPQRQVSHDRHCDLLAVLHEAVHHDLFDGLALILEHFLAIDGQGDRGIWAADLDSVRLSEVDDRLRYLHVRMNSLELLTDLLELGVVLWQRLAKELLLDELVRVVVDHRKRQEVGLRIALPGANIEHGRHVDEFEVGEVALHRFHGCGSRVLLIDNCDLARLLFHLSAVVVLADANHRL